MEHHIANSKDKGYIFIVVLFMLFLINLSFIKSIESWDKMLKREKEEELIFRGTQIINAIEMYQKKYPSALPRSLKELYEKKFLRKLYKDPMSEHGEWNIVIYNAGQKKSKVKYLVIPYNRVKKYEGSLRIVGVCSSVHEKGFKVYKEREYYDEWLFVPGLKDKIPEFEVLE